jgi:hypothetical protein
MWADCLFWVKPLRSGPRVRRSDSAGSALETQLARVLAPRALHRDVRDVPETRQCTDGRQHVRSENSLGRRARGQPDSVGGRNDHTARSQCSQPQHHFFLQCGFRSDHGSPSPASSSRFGTPVIRRRGACAACCHGDCRSAGRRYTCNHGREVYHALLRLLDGRRRFRFHPGFSATR